MKFLNKRIIIYIGATAYILMAFGWWSVLLLRKNNEAGDSKVEILRLQMQKDGTFFNEETFQKTPVLQELKNKHRRQMVMIWSEGGALFLGLLWGLWAVNRVFQKEVNLANQQHNFLLSITHELKSPIASIQLILQTFQKRKLDEKQTESLLNSAQKESERLNELVNKLLLSAKLEASYIPHMEEINVHTLLEDIIAKFHIKFPNASIQYHKKDVPILRADRQGMVSIFTNLLENAVKYAQNQSIITLNSDFKNENFIFEIVDNGRGIETIEKKKIFEKFYRIGDEETRKTKGTGLGLYIVAQIVKAHNGHIHVLDNLPSGTIFRITLPS
jgi:signal transduction histidine kinase